MVAYIFQMHLRIKGSPANVHTKKDPGRSCTLKFNLIICVSTAYGLQFYL